MTCYDVLDLFRVEFMMNSSVTKFNVENILRTPDIIAVY